MIEPQVILPAERIELEQLDVREIAQILGLSEAATKSRLRRAFQKISQLLTG